MTIDRAEFLRKYSELQDEIDFLLETKEKAEIEYIKARTIVNKLDDQLERLSKEIFRLFIESNENRSY